MVLSPSLVAASDWGIVTDRKKFPPYIPEFESKSVTTTIQLHIGLGIVSYNLQSKTNLKVILLWFFSWETKFSD